LDATPESRTPCPPVYFFVPADAWPEDMKPGSGYFWSAKRGGKWNWTFQTHEYLHAAGFPCQLVDEFPADGIIVAHTRLLAQSLVPNARQLLVCIEADRGRHPYAQLHVQQNPAGADAANAELRTRIDQCCVEMPNPNQYICYWPQPGLIPRDPSRGDRFERIVFMGRPKNLAPILQSEDWARRLTEHDLRWEIVEDRMAWRDYRGVDAIVAARDFGRDPHLDKPATKLQNAWRAGVPAVLAVESAFRAERRGELDYLEVDSADDALAALLRLKHDVGLRHAMIENGHRRAAEVTPAEITADWTRYLREVAMPAYVAWTAAPEYARKRFLRHRRVGRWLAARRNKFERRRQQRQVQRAGPQR
jgi:hypothetical protein